MDSSLKKAEYSELVNRYKHFRQVNRKLHSDLVKSLQKEQIKKSAKKLGISQSDVFVFQQEHEMDILFDYCIYDYYENGRNAVSRYINENPPIPNSDNEIVLRAMLKSFYTLIQVERVIEQVGIEANDLLYNRDFLLIDIGLSQTAFEEFVIATRIIPFGDFVMTSGAALPIDVDTLTKIMDLLTKQFDGGPVNFRDYSAEQKADSSASTIRLCLESNASSRITYEDVERNPEIIQFPTGNSHVGRNEPCPCGSGRKFKRCCGR